MRLKWRASAWLLALLSASSVFGQQVPLLDEISTVSSAVSPVESQSFSVATAGPHEISLTDLGADLPLPAPVDSIHLAVMRGSTVVATLDAEGVTEVVLPIGNYAIRVVGIPGGNAGSGLFSASVRAVGAAQPLLSFNDALSALPPTTPASVRVFQGAVSLPAGNYTLELQDLLFPGALTLGSVIVTTGASVAANLEVNASTPSASGGLVAASPATFSLFALGDSGGADAGLLAIRIRDMSNAIVYHQTLPIGRVASLGTTPALAAGSYTAALTDLAFPAALAQGEVLLTRQSTETFRLDSVGSQPLTVNAQTSGAQEVFALVTPGTTATSGALAVEIRAGAATPFTAVSTASGDPAVAPAVFSYPVEIPAASTYTATLADLQFATSLATASIAVVQGGIVLERNDAAGNRNVALGAGRAYVLVAARQATISGALQQTAGLFGVQLRIPGESPLLDITQGVGGVFSVRRFTVLTSGDYRFTLDDVGFPVAFTELAAAVTRGTERLGLIYGEGSFDVLQAPVGEYSINFITRPDSTLKAGTYALSAAIKPPTPVITLSANPLRPTVGATVELTWSTQGATSCVASSGWTGSRPTAGTERSAAITTASTFTLVCAGPGGSATSSLTVAPEPPGTNGGGGGALDLWLLAGLAGLLIGRRKLSQDGFAPV